MNFKQFNCTIVAEDENTLKDTLFILEEYIASLKGAKLKKVKYKKKEKTTVQRSPHIFKKSKQSFEAVIYVCKLTVYCELYYYFCLCSFVYRWSFPLTAEIVIEDF